MLDKSVHLGKSHVPFRLHEHNFSRDFLNVTFTESLQNHITLLHPSAPPPPPPPPPAEV